MISILYEYVSAVLAVAHYKSHARIGYKVCEQQKLFFFPPEQNRDSVTASHLEKDRNN